jgi:hypothetical protein
MAERQFQIKLLEIFNFHTITSAIDQMKAYFLLIQPPFQKGFTAKANHAII